MMKFEDYVKSRDRLDEYMPTPGVQQLPTQTINSPNDPRVKMGVNLAKQALVGNPGDEQNRKKLLQAKTILGQAQDVQNRQKVAAMVKELDPNAVKAPIQNQQPTVPTV